MAAVVSWSTWMNISGASVVDSARWRSSSAVELGFAGCGAATGCAAKLTAGAIASQSAKTSGGTFTSL
jgi:hypothetical protein